MRVRSAADALPHKSFLRSLVFLANRMKAVHTVEICQGDGPTNDAYDDGDGDDDDDGGGDDGDCHISISI